MRVTHAGRHLSVAAIAASVVLFAASPSIAGADRVRDEGVLTAYGTADTVPAGARARVQAVYNAAGDTIVTLHVWGLVPDRQYGAHAHNNPCGLNADAAGGHFQLVPNPKPAENPFDPAYANDRNEIWLDFVTDEDGNAVATTKVPWQFSPERRPGSVMIHAERTKLGGQDGNAGTAGAKLACLTVGF